jgi:hypothetical protein
MHLIVTSVYKRLAPLLGCQLNDSVSTEANKVFSVEMIVYFTELQGHSKLFASFFELTAKTSHKIVKAETKRPTS